MYIKDTGFSFAVYKYGKLIREFENYNDAREFMEELKNESI